MMLTPLHDIIDDCINRLRQGESIVDCRQRYPRTRGLGTLLEVVTLVSKLPRKSVMLDRRAVWQAIATRIKKPRSVPDNSKGYLLLFPFSRLNLLRVGALASVAVVGIASSAAFAAQQSIPGQTLYEVKRAVEQVQLVLTIDDVQKAELRLQQAEKRLTEAKIIIEQQPNLNPITIKKALTDLTDTTTKVAEQSTDNRTLLKKVVELADKQKTVLAEIETKVMTNETKQAVSKALDSSIETKAAAEKNLAKLETSTAGNSTPTSTTTFPFLPTSHSTSSDEHFSPSKSPAHPEPRLSHPTSTDSILKSFGSTGATTTDPLFISPPPPGRTTSSTPEILPTPR